MTAQQRAWVKWLHMGEYRYNTTYHMSIKMTPFMALYGYEAPSFMDLVLGDSRVPRAKDFLYFEGAQGEYKTSPKSAEIVC